MTRKHFEAIAGTIRAGFEHNAAMYRHNIIDVNGKIERDLALTLEIRRLSAIFAGFNPNFQAARFIAACRGDIL